MNSLVSNKEKENLIESSKSNNNEINMIIKINEDDINKDIYFIIYLFII